MKKLIFALLLVTLAIFAWSETVYDIQYTTDPSGDSPLVDQVVTVTGIVTANNWYSSGSTSHFVISDPEGGAWHGIYVYSFDYQVELGDEVELTATVQEYYGLTELSSVESLTILSSGNALPAAVEITTSELANSEAYEGVLVQINNVICTAEVDNYGQAYVDDGSGECQTDDAMYDFEPELESEYASIIGIVDYSFDEYGLNPRSVVDIITGGTPGFISGVVSLDGGSGNVQEAVVTAGALAVNPGADGFYLLELPAGTYEVTASLAGYLNDTVSGIVLEEGQNVEDINFTLVEIGETTIYDIQYTEDASGDSPYAGLEVTISGIVTGGGYNNNNYFFLSSPEGGAWNGIYVYQFDYEVSEGDEVTLTGTVSEYYGLTEIGNVSSLTINSSGNALPEPLAVSTLELSSTEAYESVLCQISNVTVTAEANENGESYVDDGSGECQVDDGFVSNPGLILGSEFTSITGIVDYSWDEYGLHPRSLADFVSGQTPELTDIYDIQYTEDPSGDSPYIDQEVIVNGIVTGAGYEGDKFFMSAPEGGAWNGIYVYQTDYAVEEGDEVTLTATVQEYYGFTELGNVTALTVDSSGNDLPAALEVTTSELAANEAYEAVLVKVNNVEVTIEPNNYGEAYITDGSGECQLDDGFFTYPGLAGGDVFTSITGLVDYSYNEYGLQPRYQEDFEAEIIPEQVTIYDIQYTEDPEGNSPYIDQLVEVTGIVTGSGYNGQEFFFISSIDGGAWNGLYVYQFDYQVSVGDEVTIIGVVTEYYNFTELGNVQELTINSSGNALPEAVEVTTSELATTEAYEGVLVKVNEVEVTSEVNEYGEVYINDGSGDCQLDDGFVFNPEVELGAQFVSITGLVDYSYSEYGLHPRSLDDFVTGPQWIYGDVTGDELVDAFDAANILQYSVGIDPSAVPLPWSWQLIAGDVDGNDSVEAYDAALILQYSVGILEEFPVENIRFIIPEAGLSIEQTGNELVFYAKGDLYSGVIGLNLGGLKIEEPVFKGKISNAVNLAEQKIAFASSAKLSGEIFRLAISDQNLNGSYVIDTSINGISSHQEISLQDIGEAISANHVWGAYPNPFNPQTSLKLAVKTDNTQVLVNIYNVKGQLVNTLYKGNLNAGIHSLSWNGSSAGSGVYFYQVQIGGDNYSGKMIMLK